MLSSSRDALLKFSETTSPQKLFPSDCITCTVQDLEGTVDNNYCTVYCKTGNYLIPFEQCILFTKQKIFLFLYEQQKTSIFFLQKLIVEIKYLTDCMYWLYWTVPGSIKLYKVETIMRMLWLPWKVHNKFIMKWKCKLIFCGFLRLKFADFLSMSKSSSTVIYRNKIFTRNFTHNKQKMSWQ